MMPWLLYIYAYFFSDFLRLDMSLLLLTITLRGYLISIAYCLFFIFDQIFFIFAGNKDNHKDSEEFENRSDLTMDCRVSCP